MELVILALAGAAYTIWRIQTATPNARREPVPSTGPRRCQSPLCTEPAQVNLCVGHDDIVRLCIGHGIPLLTEGLRS